MQLRKLQMARKHHTQTKVKIPVMDVVVTTAGRFDMLRVCLKSLEKQEKAPPFNVYVIDNMSENEDRLRNKDIFEMDVITASKRLTQEVGFPKLANDGAKMGTSPLVMFLSDDVELKPNVIKIVADQFKDDSIGLVGIKLLFPETSTNP